MVTLEPRVRLQLIAHAHRHCGDIVTRENLRVQFRYETGKDPEPRDLDYVLQRTLFADVDPKPLPPPDTLIMGLPPKSGKRAAREAYRRAK